MHKNEEHRTPWPGLCFPAGLLTCAGATQLSPRYSSSGSMISGTNKQGFYSNADVPSTPIACNISAPHLSYLGITLDVLRRSIAEDDRISLTATFAIQLGCRQDFSADLTPGPHVGLPIKLSFVRTSACPMPLTRSSKVPKSWHLHDEQGTNG